MKEICKLSECTACYACYNSCPKKCISFVNEENGCFVPKIDQEKCIDCGACVRSCPNNNVIELKTPSRVLAAITKNENDYITTTSGGVATTFAKHIIENGGVVYGAAVCNDAVIKHIRVDNVFDIERLKGSKYVQSEIGDCFIHIKQDLENKLPVLFVGTPCQTAGLQYYLKKKYDTLYLVDIVCHGVPPYKYLDEHIKTVCNKSFDNIIFRNEKSFYFQLRNKDSVVYENEYYKDYYYVAFLRGLVYQESCYSCKYATQDRCSDITIGDFWGFNNDKLPFITEHPYGLSLVMINNENGEKLLNECSNKFFYQERELEEAVNGNKQLRFPTVRNRKRDKFLKLYHKYGFEKAARKLLWLERLGYELINKI